MIEDEMHTNLNSSGHQEREGEKERKSVKKEGISGEERGCVGLITASAPVHTPVSLMPVEYIALPY